LLANIGFLTGISQVKFLKEIGFLIACLLAIPGLGRLKFSRFFVGLALVTWAVLSFLWSDSSGLAFVYGLRYEVSFVVLFYASYLISMRKKQTIQVLRRFVNSYFYLTVIAMLIWLFGSEILVHVGYRPDWSTFYIGEATAFCQKIEHLELCRLQGFVSGPNVFALMSLMVLAIARFCRIKDLFRVQSVLIAAIILSFSRSGILAMILYFLLEYFGGVRAIWSFTRHNIVKIGFVFVALCVSLLAFRSGSNLEHLLAWKAGFLSFLESPIWGHGVNFSGPASRFVGEGFIPESWFLQVANNLGLVGVGLFLMFMRELYNKLPKSLAHFVVAMCIPLALLHSLEDAGFAYSFAICMGLTANLDPQEN